jgi:hypothetical protein
VFYKSSLTTRLHKTHACYVPVKNYTKSRYFCVAKTEFFSVSSHLDNIQSEFGETVGLIRGGVGGWVEVVGFTHPRLLSTAMVPTTALPLS